MLKITPHDISYLLKGNETQRKAYQTLTHLKIMKILKQYHPTLTGTIPLQINTKHSDLDIICEVHDFTIFEEILHKYFSHYKDFTISRYNIKYIPSMVSNFYYNGFPVEIFAQPIKVTEQNAYRHMMVEYNMLLIAGEGAIKDIVTLKEQGIKTEPAFAQYFSLKGEPYQRLKELSYMDLNELKNFLL